MAEKGSPFKSFEEYFDTIPTFSNGYRVSLTTQLAQMTHSNNPFITTFNTFGIHYSSPLLPQVMTALKRQTFFFDKNTQVWHFSRSCILSDIFMGLFTPNGLSICNALLSQKYRGIFPLTMNEVQKKTLSFPTSIKTVFETHILNKTTLVYPDAVLHVILFIRPNPENGIVVNTTDPNNRAWKSFQEVATHYSTWKQNPEDFDLHIGEFSGKSDALCKVVLCSPPEISLEETMKNIKDMNDNPTKKQKKLLKSICEHGLQHTLFVTQTTLQKNNVSRDIQLQIAETIYILHYGIQEKLIDAEDPKWQIE